MDEYKLLELYPHLEFKKKWELDREKMFILGKCEAYIEILSRIPILPEEYQRILELSLKKGARATAAIEGNQLTDTEVEQVFSGGVVDTNKDYHVQEVKNILNAFNTLLDETVTKNNTSFITPTFICYLNRMLGQDIGNQFVGLPGEYATHQRTVGRYKCPDYLHVPQLMDKFCEWLKKEFCYPKTKSLSNTIIQAIVSHVYLEWIHPFGDGNGRTGRLLEFYILLRGGLPDIASHILSNYYNETRTQYYSELEKAKEYGNLNSFISYAATGLLNGLIEVYEDVQKSLMRLAWQKLSSDKIKEQKFAQQKKRRRLLALAVLLPLAKSFKKETLFAHSKVARLYQEMAGRTFDRDLDDLVKAELLLKGNKTYKANVDLINGMIPKKRIIL